MTDIYGVMSETRDGRGCGACHDAIQALLNEALSEMAA
jgi:NAD(P)H-nitrite reductase large subunit